MAVWGAIMGGVNLLYQGAGWLEGGLTASFEKLIVDAEILQMMSEVLQPLVVDDASLGFAAIADVGPGGHFFGTAHTLERYETAFYRPLVSDWRNFETWQADGERTATQRANAIWKQLLAEFDYRAYASEVEKGAIAALRRHKPGRRLDTNVEYYTALLLEALEIPREAFTALFAVGRVAGWCAHVFEQEKGGRIIRPQSNYVGARPG